MTPQNSHPIKVSEQKKAFDEATEKKAPKRQKVSCHRAKKMYFAAAERPKQPHDTNPIKAQIAQLVEQLAFNQLVQGSSPCLRTL
jgi:hypothetical protein